MNDKMKIIGACVLILGGVGIWVPKLPGLLGDSKASSARAPLLAEGAVLPGTPRGGAPSGGEPSGDGRATANLIAGAQDDDDPLARIEALLRDEGNSEDDGLAALAMSWQNSRGSDEQQSRNDEPSGEPSKMLDEPGKNPERKRPEPTPFNANLDGFGSTFSEKKSDPIQDPFDAFLSEYPLSGLILGKKRQLASFGPYTLEVGDFIPGTNARVRRIERRSVIVTRDRKEFSVSLPPFRSNSATTEDQLPGAVPSEDAAETTSIPSPLPVQNGSLQPAAASGGDQ